MNTQETESKKDPDLQIISLKIELCKPFYDFLKEYLNFFGSHYTVEEFCRSIVHNEVKILFNDLDDLTRSNESLLDKSDFFKKHFYIGTVSFPDPEEETLWTVRFDKSEEETE